MYGILNHTYSSLVTLQNPLCRVLQVQYTSSTLMPRFGTFSILYLQCTFATNRKVSSENQNSSSGNGKVFSKDVKASSDFVRTQLSATSLMDLPELHFGLPYLHFDLPELQIWGRDGRRSVDTHHFKDSYL